MLKSLRSCDTVIRIVNKKLLYEVLHLWSGMGYQLYYTRSFNAREVEFHVGGVLLEVVKKCLVWRSQDVVYFVHLVYFIITRKQRE